MTLYGSSGKPADYILFSTDSTHKELAYSGRIYTWIHFASSATRIFISDSGKAIAGAELVENGAKTVLTIDTSYAFKFLSNKYESY